MTKKNDAMQTASYSIRPSTQERLKRYKEIVEGRTWDEYFNELINKTEGIADEQNKNGAAID